MSLTLLIVFIVLLALMFYAIEAFVTPGIGVASVLGTACVVVDCILVYFAAGPLMAVLAVLASTALVLLFFWWLSRSKALDRVSLHAAIDSTAATAEQLSVRPGDDHPGAPPVGSHSLTPGNPPSRRFFVPSP